MTSLTLISLFLLSASVAFAEPQADAADGGLKTRFSNPDTLADGVPYGFTQLVTVQNAKTLVLPAGQTAMDINGEVPPDAVGNLTRQAEITFEAMKVVLADAGATVENVVRLRTYVKGFQSKRDLPVIRELGWWFSRTKPPANTLIGVQSLALDDLLLEVEATAVL